MNSDIGVVVTNKVQSEIVGVLKKKGVSCMGIDTFDEKNTKEFFSSCKKIVLPFPSTRSNIAFLPQAKALSEYLSKDNIVFGGMISNNLKDEMKLSEMKYCDYYENEAYVLKNAQLTSQGAVRLLLENTNEFLVGKKALVTGFGRIGKSLAFLLKSLGIKVFIAARREEAAVEASAFGFEVISFSALKGAMFYFDFIFNTVPSVVFSYRDIAHINDGSIYFELASDPFGAEKKNFELLGKKYVHGGALPGRFYPSAVAQNIVDFILLNAGEFNE